MEHALTILHIYGVPPESAEAALTAIFAREERPSVLRLEGTFRAVLARATAPELQAAYRYLICRPHPTAQWTPVLELGNRTDGLDLELSRALEGAVVFTTYVYDDGLSGYRCARGGTLVDQYQSDPTYFAEDEVAPAAIAAQRGDPARFAELLPAGTTPEDFARVVLRPGWWEEYDSARVAPAPESGTRRPDSTEPAAVEQGEQAEEEELVDEVDRMRCIALALELWGPEAYPFTQDLETLENKLVGPAIALAYT